MLLFFAYLVAAGCMSTQQLVAFDNPSWEVQYEDSTALFIALSIVDESTVWVSGAPGKVGRTTDGGETWTMFDGQWPDSLQFRDVHAFSEDEAFILSIGNGLDSRIYHTTDGGQSWRLSFQNEDPNAFYDCFSFWNRQRGFVFSDSHEGEFILIRTMDGGDSWQYVDPANIPRCQRRRGFLCRFWHLRGDAAGRDWVGSEQALQP